MECIPVCNTSGERSFSALKRVKNYQRSTVIQDNLNDLAILFIENDFMADINFDQIIDKFAGLKARKKII